MSRSIPEGFRSVNERFRKVLRGGNPRKAEFGHRFDVLHPLPSFPMMVHGFFELGIPVLLKTVFRHLSSFSAHFFVFVAIFGHAEVMGGRLEGPHAVGHGGTRGEPREVSGWG